MRKTTLRVLVCSLLLFVCSAAHTMEIAGAPDNPPEVGNVRWQRDFGGALQLSQQSGKPVFLLFQEVPGCIGCKTFGTTVLTEPLLVEAIEDLFIPVLVYNNRFGGEDEALLRRFQEPSWNFQVIRFLDGKGDDIIPRKEQVWTVVEVVGRMIQALQQSGRKVPRYLDALRLEYDTEGHQKVGFGLACFWVGEYLFGSIPGVVKTEAGWYENREMTLVTFHRDYVALDELVDFAEGKQCAERVYLFDGRQDYHPSNLASELFDKNRYRTAGEGDQKKQLQGWYGLHRVKYLTEMQMTKLNGFWPDDQDEGLGLLSPRQRAMLVDH